MPQRSAVVRIIKRVLPSVVSIRSLVATEAPSEAYAVSGEPEPPADTLEGEAIGGSGFLVSPDGIIVTNKHVVANAGGRYEVIAQNGKRSEARVIARDPATDVAFLKIPGRRLPTIALGTAKTLELGEEVIAIGNALGQFSNTVSLGIVSGLSRSLVAALDESGTVEELEGLIQTDAAINPGNSGGPLINLRGEAVGVNIATVLGAQNLGFAVPIDIVRRDLDDLKRFGRVRRLYLGIRYLPIDEEIAREYKLAEPRGALVYSDTMLPAVAPGSPAARAGIRPLDVIIAVNGKRVTAEQTLSTILTQVRADRPVHLTVLRAGRRLRVAVAPMEWQDGANANALHRRE